MYSRSDCWGWRFLRALLDSAAYRGSTLFGAILGYAVLWSLNALYRRFRGFDGLGGGDLKMMAALGGWFGASSVVDVLTLASLLALWCPR